MNSAKKLLQFDFDATRFARQAPTGLKMPAAHKASLRKIASEHEGKGLEMPNQESIREIYQLCMETPSDQLSEVFDSTRRIRHLAWALTYSEAGSPAVVEDTSKLRAVLRIMNNRFRISALGGIFYALLKTWDTPNAGLLRSFLEKRLRDYRGSRKFALNLKENTAWYCEEKGAEKLAMFLISVEKQVSDIWEYLGLPESTHNYAYFSEVGRVYTTFHKLTEDYVADVVKFVRKHNNAQATKTIVSKLIEKLGREASEAVRAPVQSYGLQEWQDPRIAGADVRWSGISDKAREIFTYWITKEDLHFFFDVVAKACNDQKFEYRKAFWLAYLEHITFCRPVLRKGAEYLFRHDQQALEYYRDRKPADLKGGNRDQHAFIIQMGEFTFVEFSTAAACQVYRSDKLPFELDYSEYAMDDLRFRRFAIHKENHTNSEGYRWQDKFRGWLEDELGIEPLRSYRLDSLSRFDSRFSNDPFDDEAPEETDLSRALRRSINNSVDEDVINETEVDEDIFDKDILNETWTDYDAINETEVDDDIDDEVIDEAPAGHEIIPCPNWSCTQELQVPIFDKKVRCPKCKTVFEQTEQGVWQSSKT